MENTDNGPTLLADGRSQFADGRIALIRQADKARIILTGMAKPQKRFSGRAKPGY